MDADIASFYEILEPLEDSSRDPAEIRAGLEVLLLLVQDSTFVDRPRQALDLTERALAVSQRVQSVRPEAYFISYRGFARYLLSDHELALKDLHAGEALLRDLNDDVGLVRTLSIMAGTYLSLGDYEKALEISTESLALAQRTGDRESEAWTNHGMATGLLELGDTERAREHNQAALDIFSEIGLIAGRARALTGLATVCRIVEDYDQAEAYLEESLHLFRAEGVKLGEARALSDLGIVYHHRGRHDDARRCHKQALQMRIEIGNKQSQATSLIELGRLAVDDDEALEAKEYLERALAIGFEINSKPRIYQAHEVLADAYALTGDFDRALAHYQAYNRVKEEVLGEQASTRLRNQQVSFAVERSERESEINRLKNIELRNKNEQLQSLLRELKETQAQLVQSEKMASVGQLVAGLVHELNSPLGALGSAVDVARRAADRGERQLAETDLEGLARTRATLDRNLEIMSEASARLIGLIANLKSFVQLDQSAVQLADINTGLRATLELIRPQLGPDVELAVELGDLPAIHCRPGEINQVVMHLLTNAVRAAGPRGRIAVTTRHEGDEVAITVTDDGPGIPPERLERLFEPDFSRSGARVKAGMGLFLSQSIVQRHGGRIEVASEPGQGSEFTVHLPLMMAKEA